MGLCSDDSNTAMAEEMEFCKVKRKDLGDWLVGRDKIDFGQSVS
jgi:hypothetical protein